MLHAGDGHNSVAGNVHQCLPNTYCPGQTPESAALLPHPGDLISPRFDAVRSDTKGVFQGVVLAPVVPPLPGQQPPEPDANPPVGVVPKQVGKFTK